MHRTCTVILSDMHVDAAVSRKQMALHAASPDGVCLLRPSFGTAAFDWAGLSLLSGASQVRLHLRLCVCGKWRGVGASIFTGHVCFFVEESEFVLVFLSFLVAVMFH